MENYQLLKVIKKTNRLQAIALVTDWFDPVHRVNQRANGGDFNPTFTVEGAGPDIAKAVGIVGAAARELANVYGRTVYQHNILSSEKKKIRTDGQGTRKRKRRRSHEKKKAKFWKIKNKKKDRTPEEQAELHDKIVEKRKKLEEEKGQAQPVSDDSDDGFVSSSELESDDENTKTITIPVLRMTLAFSRIPQPDCTIQTHSSRI
ncbi:hypothetical protein BZA70DRAFT_85666 [Myxozyma melibiosi]|uniref:DNA/RNA-binding protein Alba-like domain-containing protein n=1 Tax=Myxozyma melibiosi TaxID=54550 RepID=A0ABR1F049_9ASCO